MAAVPNDRVRLGGSVTRGCSGGRGGGGEVRPKVDR
jgi:hypothetical protein